MLEYNRDRMPHSLFYILGCIVNDAPLDSERLKSLSPSDWTELYRIAKRQGVTAVLFEKVQQLPKELAPSKGVVMRWISNTLSIEKQTKAIYKRCTDFAQLMHEHGLQTLVMKGVAISQYYPTPWYREFGDLDCYLYRDSDEGVIWELLRGGKLHR